MKNHTSLKLRMTGKKIQLFMLAMILMITTEHVQAMKSGKAVKSEAPETGVEPSRDNRFTQAQQDHIMENMMKNTNYGNAHNINAEQLNSTQQNLKKNPPTFKDFDVNGKPINKSNGQIDLGDNALSNINDGTATSNNNSISSVEMPTTPPPVTPIIAAQRIQNAFRASRTKNQNTEIIQPINEKITEVESSNPFALENTAPESLSSQPSNVSKQFSFKEIVDSQHAEKAAATVEQANSAEQSSNPFAENAESSSEPAQKTQPVSTSNRLKEAAKKVTAAKNLSKNSSSLRAESKTEPTSKVNPAKKVTETKIVDKKSGTTTIEKSDGSSETFNAKNQKLSEKLTEGTKTTDITYKKPQTADGKSNDLSSTRIIKDSKNPDLTITEITNKKGKVISRTTFHSKNEIKVVEDLNQNTTTMTTKNGKKVTIYGDGSYAIQGKNTIIHVSADGTITREPRTMTTAAKRAISSVIPRSAKIEELGITVKSDGTISTNNIDMNFDGDGNLFITEKDSFGQKPITHTISSNGSIKTSQEIALTKVEQQAQPPVTKHLKETYEDGPEFTTQIIDENNSFSALPNSNGSLNTIRMKKQSGKDIGSITIVKENRTGLFGRSLSDKRFELTFDDVARELSKASPNEKSYDAAIDKITAKLTGNNNWIFGKTIDIVKLKNSPEYRAFKKDVINSVLEKVEKQSYLERTGEFVKRSLSFLTARAITFQSKAIRNTQSQAIKKSTSSTTSAHDAPFDNSTAHQPKKYDATISWNKNPAQSEINETNWMN